MSYPQLTFLTFDQLLAYINAYWIANNEGAITGPIGNNVVNGLLTFIRQSPINWEKTSTWSSGGILTIPSAQIPDAIVIFVTTTPTSLSFSDNIWFEYYFLNATTNNIPLIGSSYYDTTLTVQTSIPAQSVVHLVKSKNNTWIQVGGFSNGSLVGSKKPLTGIAGGPNSGDPIIGETIYQSALLIGLGGPYGRIGININGATLFNYGTNKAFDFDPLTGEITGLNAWQNLDSIYIGLNQ